MATSKELLKAPILPNKSAAGVKLGATTKAVQKLWGEPLKIEQIKPDHVRWEYQDVVFFFKRDKLTQIWVRGLYDGQTKEGIRLGSTRQDVEAVYGELEWDGTWLINVPPFGIGFDFINDLMSLETRVSDIFVFRE
jgi:hypothetical protein